MKKKNRVLKNLEFQEIISKRNRLSKDGFYLYFKNKENLEARVGISVSKKIGNAIIRNKIKRQIRMMLGQILNFNEYDYDLIIIARNSYFDNSYENNKKILERLLKKVKINRKPLERKNYE